MATPLKRACVAPVISSGAVTSDASTQVGDLLVFVGFSQGPVLVSIVHSIQSGFVSLHDEGLNDGADDGRLTVAAKIATVAGAQSYTPWSISGANANQTSIGIYIVQAGTFDPAIITAFPAANHAGVVGTGTTAPNPPQVTPTTGLDYIILALGAWHVTAAEATDAGAPASYTMAGENDPSGSHVTHLAIAERTMTALAAAENPGSFTDNIAAPNGNIAVTIAIVGYPAAQSAAAGLATVTSSALDSTVTPGGVSVVAGLATATGSALASTVTPGAVSVAAGLATASSAGLDAAVTPGAVSASADLASVGASAFDATVTPGAVDVAAGLASATTSALDAAVTPGAVSVAAEIATVTAGALDSTVTPGGVSAAAGRADMATLVALDASVTPGGVSVGAGLAEVVAFAFDARAFFPVGALSIGPGGIAYDGRLSAEIDYEDRLSAELEVTR